MSWVSAIEGPPSRGTSRASGPPASTSCQSSLDVPNATTIQLLVTLSQELDATDFVWRYGVGTGGAFGYTTTPVTVDGSQTSASASWRMIIGCEPSRSRTLPCVAVSSRSERAILKPSPSLSS